MRNKKLVALAATCMLSTTLLFTGCSSSDSSSASDSAASTYSAAVTGMSSDVEVTITVEDGQITACSIDASGETEGIGTLVPDTMEEDVVAKQGVDVDVVSGATITSNAAIEALADAMSQAGLAQ